MDIFLIILAILYVLVGLFICRSMLNDFQGPLRSTVVGIFWLPLLVVAKVVDVW